MTLGPYGALALVRGKIAQLDHAIDSGAVFSREEMAALCDTLAYLAKYAPRDLFGDDPEQRPVNTPSSPVLLTNQDAQ